MNIIYSASLSAKIFELADVVKERRNSSPNAAQHIINTVGHVLYTSLNNCWATLQEFIVS